MLKVELRSNLAAPLRLKEQGVVGGKQRVERGPQVVGHRGEEEGLHLALDLGLLALADGGVVTHQDQKLILSLDCYTLEINCELNWLGELSQYVLLPLLEIAYQIHESYILLPLYVSLPIVCYLSESYLLYLLQQHLPVVNVLPICLPGPLIYLLVGRVARAHQSEGLTQYQVEGRLVRILDLFRLCMHAFVRSLLKITMPWRICSNMFLWFSSAYRSVIKVGTYLDDLFEDLVEL